MAAIAAVGKELIRFGKGTARRDFHVVRREARFQQEQAVGLPQIDGPDAVSLADTGGVVRAQAASSL